MLPSHLPRRLAPLTLVMLVLVAVAACVPVEGTGRSRLLMTSAAQENAMGAQAYREILGKEKRCTDPATIALVERVGRRLAAVADPNGAHGFQWEFTVLESEEMNAFCLPGGKVAFYTGILPLCRNEAGMAAVMGHEIAHAIARHGGERMSQQQAAGLLSGAVAIALEANRVEPTTANVAMAAFGMGTQLGVLLPFSRAHELEADALGLQYMAKAGYEPQEAVAFWERFAQVGGGGPTFLSTHPASSDRAEQMTANLAQAQQCYQSAANRYGAGDLVPPSSRAAPAASSTKP